MLTFDQFVQAGSQTGKPKPPTPSPVRQSVIDQMIRAKIIPATAFDMQHSATETAKFLSDQVSEMHAQIIRDGSANMNERRMSYQAVCLSLMIMLAMAGTTEDQQE